MNEKYKTNSAIQTVQNVYKEMIDAVKQDKKLRDKIFEIATEISEANRARNFEECLLIAILKDRDDHICLPIWFNPPEGWYDVTTAEQESKNPHYRFYVKGRCDR